MFFIHHSPVSKSAFQLLGRRTGDGAFPKERGLKDSDCRSQISHIIANKKKEIEALKINILDNFEQLLEECGEGGERFKYYLTFFAGKDLLYMIRSELKKLGFKDSPQPACYVFRERILRGIQSSPEKVWTWLPEWQKLRELISEFTQILITAYEHFVSCLHYWVVSLNPCFPLVKNTYHDIPAIVSTIDYRL